MKKLLSILLIFSIGLLTPQCGEKFNEDSTLESTFAMQTVDRYQELEAFNFAVKNLITDLPDSVELNPELIPINLVNPEHGVWLSDYIEQEYNVMNYFVTNYEAINEMDHLNEEQKAESRLLLARTFLYLDVWGLWDIIMSGLDKDHVLPPNVDEDLIQVYVDVVKGKREVHTTDKSIKDLLTTFANRYQDPKENKETVIRELKELVSRDNRQPDMWAVQLKKYKIAGSQTLNKNEKLLLAYERDLFIEKLVKDYNKNPAAMVQEITELRDTFQELFCYTQYVPVEGKEGFYSVEDCQNTNHGENQELSASQLGEALLATAKGTKVGMVLSFMGTGYMFDLVSGANLVAGGFIGSIFKGIGKVFKKVVKVVKKIAKVAAPFLAIAAPVLGLAALAMPAAFAAGSTLATIATGVKAATLGVGLVRAIEQKNILGIAGSALGLVGMANSDLMFNSTSGTLTGLGTIAQGVRAANTVVGLKHSIDNKDYLGVLSGGLNLGTTVDSLAHGAIQGGEFSHSTGGIRKAVGAVNNARDLIRGIENFDGPKQPRAPPGYYSPNFENSQRIVRLNSGSQYILSNPRYLCQRYTRRGSVVSCGAATNGTRMQFYSPVNATPSRNATPVVGP